MATVISRPPRSGRTISSVTCGASVAGASVTTGASVGGGGASVAAGAQAARIMLAMTRILISKKIFFILLFSSREIVWIDWKGIVVGDCLDYALKHLLF